LKSQNKLSLLNHSNLVSAKRQYLRRQPFKMALQVPACPFATA
jgi:hypothetical protein